MVFFLCVTDLNCEPTVKQFVQVSLEGLRIKIPPGTSQHMSRLVKICMNEEAAKQPRFDMVIPIMEKMKTNA